MGPTRSQSHPDSSSPLFLTTRRPVRHDVDSYPSFDLRRRVLETVAEKFRALGGRALRDFPRVTPSASFGARPASSPPSLAPSPYCPNAGLPRISSSPQIQLFTLAITATSFRSLSDQSDGTWRLGRRRKFGSMPSIFPSAGSTTTASSDIAESSPASASLRSLSKKLSAPQLNSASRSLSPSRAREPSPSPSTLSPRSVSPRPDSKGDDDSRDGSKSREESVRTSIFRRLSPGLAARVKQLNGSAESSTSTRRRKSVGRIPEDQIRELDNLHRSRSGNSERRERPVHGLQIKKVKSTQSLLGSETKPGTPVSPVTPTSPRPTEPSIVSTPALSVNISPSTSSEPPKQPGSRPATMATMASTESRTESNGVEGSSDLEEYLRRTSGQPPQPPPKDTPPASSSSSNVVSYFNPFGLARAESIYSFSRTSFNSQLSQLTSINLPQPSALESSITSIVTAPIAVKALIGAAEQIQKWINKASEVLDGLDAEDDVEWAAAGGREGLEEVNKAVNKFESLVNVYVRAIENVQVRDDIGDVSADDLKLMVAQMEATVKNWAQIRNKLKGVKEQVELAMEWEELWNNVLGDVGLEIDNLSRLIFEMEEKRHQSLVDADGEHGNGLDINELETIVEESPKRETPASSNRLSIAVFPSTDTTGSGNNGSNPQNDANLMQLFARMQPLRASLDFLPMRLSMFQSRAERIFPTACEELEDRRKRLEKDYQKLQEDAEALRRELGEDRWIIVFRNAGKQAQKMCESVERSIGKLQESLEANDQVNNPPVILKKIESYEAKKTHYIPAIDRVLSIIQKGVKDRLTVNGEIVTLLHDMEQRQDALKASIKVMDSQLEDTTISQSQHLRDSTCTIITTESPANTSAIATPGSSPASSVILNGPGRGATTPNPGGSSRRGSSVASTARSTLGVRRLSSNPQLNSTNRRKSSIPRAALSPTTPSATSGGASVTTPSPAARSRRVSTTSNTSTASAPARPRWNNSANTNDLDVGHNFKPLTLTTPSPYRKTLPVPAAQRRSASAMSSTSARSPLGQTSTSGTGATRSSSTRPTSRLSERSSRGPEQAASPTPSDRKGSSLLDPVPYSKLRRVPAMDNTARSRQSYAGPPTTRTENESNDSKQPSRPGTALGHNSRRSSMLPQTKRTTGKSKLDERPPWR
ncbi:hypothetical protein VTN49DRAFT_3444 [Thermomyces lanuginosus]|uniref:uncharacterized protein n=1 Tax=Thermomyces lanuginosus TaxID=5541 RepID=UPI0037442775